MGKLASVRSNENMAKQEKELRKLVVSLISLICLIFLLRPGLKKNRLTQLRFFFNT